MVQDFSHQQYHAKSLGRFRSGTRPNRATAVHCHIAMVKTSVFSFHAVAGGQLGGGSIVPLGFFCSLKVAKRKKKHVVTCLFKMVGVIFFIDLYTYLYHEKGTLEQEM